MRFGSTIVGSRVDPSTTTPNSHSSGSLQTTSRASFVNGESTQKCRRVTRLVVRSNSETAATIVGFLGRQWRRVVRKLGHNVGKVVIIEATTALGGFGLSWMLMAVVVGERSEGMNGINLGMVDHDSRYFRFGSNGSPIAEDSRTAKTSEDKDRLASSLIIRILRAYFRNRAHSSVVGSLLKDFRSRWLRKRKTRVIGALTVYLPSFQTSPGKDLSNRSTLSWVSHNTSNAGSSKVLQQQAKATAVAFASDPTSSRTRSLRISSTLRHTCIGSIECV